MKDFSEPYFLIKFTLFFLAEKGNGNGLSSAIETVRPKITNFIINKNVEIVFGF